MPTYCYRCPKGHPSENYYPFSQTPSAITCFCGATAPRDRQAEMRTITPILPRHFTPHYHPAFGEHVESQQHLEHLQRTHGTCDMGSDDFGEPPTHFDSKGYSEPVQPPDGAAPIWSVDDTPGVAEVVGKGI